MLKSVQCLVISISNPILIGIYQDGQLIEVFNDDGKASEVLAHSFKNILEKYSIEQIYYVNGPGSYMAIKVAYIFLKSLSLTLDIPFSSCSGFSFNGKSPIKALGKKYFIQEDEKIITDFIDKTVVLNDFKLPEQLNKNIFSDDTLPNYQLPVV